MRLDANTAWFTIKLDGNDEFGVYAFGGTETIHEPYEFQVELVHTSASVDVASFLGKPACLSIADVSGQQRHVHGIVCEMEQGHTGNKFTQYQCTIVPRLWFMGYKTDHRIFQNKKVDDIIKKVLSEQGIAADFKLSKSYEEREYCVQYGESTLHFISRLCEEEGIYYYFEHTESEHKLCFCDGIGGPPIAGESDLRFYPGSGNAAETAVISRLKLHERSNRTKATYREWNFEKPRLDLEVSQKEESKVPQGMELEAYTYPHLYQLRKPGGVYAELQAKRQVVFNRWIDCQSDASRFLPSYTFAIKEHPNKGVNAKWWVISVTHTGTQPGVLEHEAPDTGLYYSSQVLAIPDTVRFIPALAHPKERVEGVQTAIVTGPEGEEIYPDKYGRVKVQFHWDREGQQDENTTCWIRASQGWAGTQFGTMAIPRIGHEVIVSFLEGDPDRPLITGRVYHELNRVPYELPAHKTRTVFKSMSTPGKEGEPRGFNELRIEDKKGEEEIYAHAEKDVNIHVKNDWKEHILRDFHATTDRHTYTLTKGETHETLTKARKTELHANDNLTVHADKHVAVDGKWLGKAGEEIHLKAGEKLVLEAGTELTIKAGGSWIKLDPSGVHMGGSRINLGGGGSAGSGSGAGPELPEGSIATDAGSKPKTVEKNRFVNTMREAQQNSQPLCSTCQMQGGGA